MNCRSGKMKKVPYKDYKGNEIYDGDILIHPICKSIFIIVYDETYSNPWRALYENGDNLFLGQQVSDKGMAAKV